MMQKELARQSDMFRQVDESHEPLLSARQPYFSNMAYDPMPLSPRQAPQDDRRPSIPAISRQSFFRPPPPPHLNLTPRRYGSIGNNSHSPSYHRPSITPQPPAPPSQHPLASVSEPGPNLARRHTSADIRDTAGWPPQPSFENQPSSAASSNWPPSPQIHTPSQSDQHVRDVLSKYTLGGPRRDPDPHSLSHSRQSSPPPSAHDPPASATGVGENGWSFGVNKFPSRLLDSAPPTRRSSMASNVHSLLNPADTTEREDEDGTDDRKRKRLG